MARPYLALKVSPGLEGAVEYEKVIYMAVDEGFYSNLTKCSGTVQFKKGHWGCGDWTGASLERREVIRGQRRRNEQRSKQNRKMLQTHQASFLIQSHHSKLSHSSIPQSFKSFSTPTNPSPLSYTYSSPPIRHHMPSPSSYEYSLVEFPLPQATAAPLHLRPPAVWLLRKWDDRREITHLGVILC
ncbi:hypothetical protein L1049_001077 [Liquidambar formosana]|uniref:Uncharacterized protein n=1 Tax=Liquidambar formosana TaxID=63359 RepID=A0AAP0NBN8_LIQFO